VKKIVRENTVREKNGGGGKGKKIREISTKKKVREKNKGERVRETKRTGKKGRPDRASSVHVILSLPVKKAPLWRILRNFRMRMRRTYFRTGSLPVKHAQWSDPHRSSANDNLSVPIYY
jgi:hypothetical protein